MGSFIEKATQFEPSGHLISEQQLRARPASSVAPEIEAPSDPTAGSTFAYAESIRCTSEPVEADLEALTRYYVAVEDSAGIPLGGTILTDTGAVVSPGQLMSTALVPSPTGGYYVVGSLAPSALGFPSVTDVASRDGRNLVWAEQTPVLGTFLFLPEYVHRYQRVGGDFTTPYALANTNAVAESVDGAWFAAMEHIGGSRFDIRVFDRATGDLRLSIPSAGSGSESIHFSPDGSWLLVDGWIGASDEKPNLIHLGTGRGMTLDVGGHVSINWFPSAGPSTLLGSRMGSERSATELFTFDLATATEAVVGEVDIHPGSAALGLVDQLRPHRDGRQILCLTFAGLTVEHQQQHGGRTIATLIDLEDMSVEPVKPQFLSDVPGAQRSHKSPTWLNAQDAPAAALELCPDLESRLSDVTGDVDDAWSDRVASASRTMLQHCMMSVSGEAGIERPSLVTSLFARAIKDWAQCAPRDYAESTEAISEFVFSRAFEALGYSGSDPDTNAVRQIGLIEQAAREARFDEIDSSAIASSWM